MSGYTIPQWILFFFLYAFFGWIWEVGLNLVQKHRFVNRGFLTGPILPIYGFGAVSILLFTIQVRWSIGLIFLCGMAGATVLEYFTGWLLERLFRMRYWDYSNLPLNLNGYICLLASLCWGVFSVLLVRVVHPPLAGLIQRLGEKTTAVLAAVLVCAGIVDLAFALVEAISVRQLLEKLESSRARVTRLQRLLEASAVFAAEDYRKRYEAQRGKLAQSWNAARDALQATRERRTVLLGELKEKIELALQDSPLPELRHGLTEIEQELRALGERTDRLYRRAFGQLRRNPTAHSRRYEETLRELRALFFEDHKK